MTYSASWLLGAASLALLAIALVVAILERGHCPQCGEPYDDAPRARRSSRTNMLDRSES